jgi:hypothetical protein
VQKEFIVSTGFAERSAVDLGPRRPHSALGLAGWLLMTSLPAFGQATGVVKGRVVDSSSAPARTGIAVSVLGTPLAAVSAGDGRFLIARVPAGERRLRVRGIGIIESNVPVTVRSDDTTEIDIVVRSAVVSLEAMRIDAAAAEREAFATRPNVGALGLTARAMQAVPRIGEADPMRVIAMTPGVQSRNDFSTGFNVRGGESDQNLILLDDYPIYNPFHLGGLFSTFISSGTRNVQLFNGAFPARYGGRLSSVIDVQSREDPRPGFHGNADVSMLASTLSAGGAIGSRGTWMIAGRRTYADQMAKVFTDDAVPYYFRDEQAHASYELPSGFRLSATLYDGRDVLDGSFGQITDSATAANEGRFALNWGNLVGGITLSRGLYSASGDSTIISQRISTSRFSTNYDAGSGARTLYNELHDLRFAGAISRHARAHSPSIGYEVSRYDVDYRRGSPTGTLDLITSHQDPMTIAAFVDDLWRLGTRVLLSGGLRVERIGGLGWTALSPRASVKVLTSDRAAFTAAVGRFTQSLHTLSYEDDPIRLFDYWRAADSASAPSRAWQVVLGHERWLSPTRSVRIEGFYKRYRELLEPNFADDPRVDGDEFLNSDGKSYGADVFLRAFEAGPFSGWLSYTYAHSERKRDTIRYTPSQDRRHDVNLIASWRVKKFVAGARLAFASGMPYTDAVGSQPRRYYDPVSRQWGVGTKATFQDIGGARNAARYPATRRVDLLVERPFTRGRVSFAPYVSIVNATDARNVLFYTYRFSSSPAVRQTVTQFPFLPSAGVSIAY